MLRGILILPFGNRLGSSCRAVLGLVSDQWMAWMRRWIRTCCWLQWHNWTLTAASWSCCATWRPSLWKHSHQKRQWWPICSTPLNLSPHPTPPSCMLQKWASTLKMLPPVTRLSVNAPWMNKSWGVSLRGPGAVTCRATCSNMYSWNFNGSDWNICERSRWHWCCCAFVILCVVPLGHYCRGSKSPKLCHEICHVFEALFWRNQ